MVVGGKSGFLYLQMKMLQWILSKITPRYFFWVCLALSGLWFLGIYPALNWICPGRLPWSMAALPATEISDFDQYYAGAVVARYGLWEHLYPVPKEEIYHSPPHFEPKWKTRFFNPDKINGVQCYYPAVADMKVSTYAPEVLAICPKLAISPHYMYPPPLALLLGPLAFLSLETAATKVWPTLLMFALFGVSYLSSRMHRFLHGKASYAEGLIILAGLFFSLQAAPAFQHPIWLGNVTPLLSFLIALAAYAWMRGWQVAVGAAMIPLVLFKSIGLTWCPLLLLRRIQWRTLCTLAALTVGLNGAVLWLGGSKVYGTYFQDILPKAAVPVGTGMVYWLFQWFGVYPQKLFLVCTVLLLAMLYVGYWRSRSGARSAAAIPATLAGTLAVFCMLNFSVWPSYFSNYLYFPFLGWILWEGSQAKGPWRTAIYGGAAIAFALLSFDGTVQSALLRLFGKHENSFCIVTYSLGYSIVFPLFVLALAYRRFFLSAPGETAPATGTHNASPKTWE